MLADNISLFLRYIRYLNFQESFLVRWDKKSGTLKLVTNKKTWKKYNLKIYLHILQGLTVLAQMVLSDNDDGGYLLRVLYEGFAAMFYGADAIDLWLGKTETPSLILYINGLLQYSRTYGKGDPKIKLERSLNETLNVLFSHGLYVSGLVAPFAYLFGLHWRNPCKVSMPGYWVLMECSGKVHQTLPTAFTKLLATVQKLILISANYWLFGFGSSMIYFIVGGVQVLCTISIRGYIRMFHDQGVSRKSSVQRMTLMYRHIQLLANLNNCTQQNSSALKVVAGPVIMVSLCAYITLKISWTMENFVPLLFSVQTIFATILLILVCLSGYASIYSESEDSLRSLKWHTSEILMGGSSRREVLLRRKFYNSCPIIKIKLGATNFIESGTPMTCLDLAIGNTVNLLLM